MRETVKILGVEIDNVTLDEAGEMTKTLIENSHKNCELIVAPNVEFIMRAQKDKAFFDILNSAQLATPDSIGVEIGARLQKKHLKQRIPGQAYFRKVLEIGEEQGWTFYFLGGKGNTVQRAVNHVKESYPHINIVGFHEGFFEENSEEEVIQEINLLKPNVLFVAMGAPAQEKWIASHKNKLQVDVAAGQGGTFDYEAGNIRRAPQWMQKCGLEWLWRLILQPTRIVRMAVLPIYLIKIIFTKDRTRGKWSK